MKKFLIAAGVASLLIAAQAVASDVAGVSEGAPRVTDRLAASYNASLNASTTQETGKCAIREGKTFMGRDSSVTDYYDNLTAEQCEQRRADLEANPTNPLTTTGVTAVFTAVAVVTVVTNDAAQTD